MNEGLLITIIIIFFKIFYNQDL